MALFGNAGTRWLHRAPASPPLRYVSNAALLVVQVLSGCLSLVIQGFSGSEAQGRTTSEHLCAAEHGGASQTLQPGEGAGTRLHCEARQSCLLCWCCQCPSVADRRRIAPAGGRAREASADSCAQLQTRCAWHPRSSPPRAALQS